MFKNIFIVIILLICLSCNGQTQNTTTNDKSLLSDNATFDTTTRTIHIFVALCDNKYQGIVPVPKAIGNGQDPANNLYWGCAYGIRTYFKNSKDWKLLKTKKIDSTKLERAIYKHVTKNYYLVADAYNGKYIKQCTKDFLHSCAGQIKDTLIVDNTIIGIAGNAKLNAYIGHDGLMDFTLNKNDYKNADNITRDAIILACYSKKFFTPHLQMTKAKPLVWTTHLMAPEAYTIHDALTGYIDDEPAEEIRTRAAKAYAKYQKCSEKAARGLLVTGY